MGRLTFLAGASSVIVVALVTASCARDPEVAKRDHLEKGNQYFSQEKFSEAIIEYRNAVKVAPTFGEARRRLAEAYARSGDGVNAYREYTRAADLLPDDTDLQLTAGGFRLIARQFDDARAAADKVLARDPANVRALILRANAIAGLKNLDDAVKDVEEAIKLDPAGSELYTNLGALEMHRHNQTDAEAAFQRAVQVDPKSARAHAALGNFYWSTKRPADAERAFSKAVELDPRDAVSNRALALFYLSTGRSAEAEKPIKGISEAVSGVEGRLALADYYLLSGRSAEGAKVLEAAFSEKGGFVPAKSRQAALLYSQGRRDEAHKIVDELLVKDQGQPQALLLKARFLLLEQKPDEALVRAQAAVAADPQSARAFYLLGLIHMAKGNRDEATKAFGEVVRLNPRAAAAQAQLSRLHLAGGNVAASVQAAEQAVKNAPAVPEAHLVLARSLVATGNLTRAETELKQIERKYPNSSVVLSLLGNVYVNKKDYAQARRAYEQAYKQDGSLEALSGLVGLDLVANKPQDARSRVDAQLARTPRSAPALVLAAKTYGATRDVAKAESLLRSAIEADPSDPVVYGMLGQLYYTNGRLAEGRAEFENLLKQRPDSVSANTMLAIILSKQGHAAEAKARYEKVLALDSHSVVAANNLAWMYAENGENLDTALQLAQAALAQLPNQTEVRDTLALVYQKKGLPKLAIPLLQQNVDQEPKNPVYQYRLGVAQANDGNSTAARNALQKALALNPGFNRADDARRVLSTLQ
jgi:putative PEP-CTERM system TPR-repeat lipoprotein